MLNKLRNSSSYQVGVILALLMAIAMVFVTFWIMISSGESLITESEEAVRSELRGLVLLEARAGESTVVEELTARQRERPDGYFYALRDAGGELVAGNIPRWPDRAVRTLEPGLILFEIDHDLLPERSGSRFIFSSHFDVLAKTHRFDSGSVLLVGRDIDDLRVAQFVASSFGWVMIAILASISLLGFGVSYYVSTRFDRIAATTTRIIETGNLSERLLVDGEWDDLSKLSALLNRMLAELEQRVAGIKSVSDNIAHDLRTPLMRLRTQIEALPEHAQKAELLEELDGVLTVFQSLLRISSIEAGNQMLAAGDVDLAALVEDATGLYAPLIEEKDITLTCALVPVRLQGDRDLLFQCVANLIDNATKFTPSGGAIRCELLRADPHVKLVVSDTGPGIPNADRERVLERFQRLDSSRHIPGNGLGLSFVAAVIRRHRGSLTLDAASADEHHPGLRVTIELPSVQT